MKSGLRRAVSAPDLLKVVAADSSARKPRSASANAANRNPVQQSSHPAAGPSVIPSSTADAMQRMAKVPQHPPQEKTQPIELYIRQVVAEIEKMEDVKAYIGSNANPSKGTVIGSVQHVISEGAQVLRLLTKEKVKMNALYYDGKLTPFMLVLAHVAAETKQYDNSLLHLGLGQGDKKYQKRLKQGKPALTFATLEQEYAEMINPKGNDEKNFHDNGAVSADVSSDSDNSPPDSPRSHSSSDDSDENGAMHKQDKKKVVDKVRAKIHGVFENKRVFMPVSVASSHTIGGDKLKVALTTLSDEKVSGVDFLSSGDEKAALAWRSSYAANARQKKAKSTNQDILTASKVKITEYSTVALSKLDGYTDALLFVNNVLLKESAAAMQPLRAALIKSVKKHFMPPVIPQKQSDRARNSEAKVDDKLDDDLRTIVDAIFQILSAPDGDTNKKLDGAAGMLSGFSEGDGNKRKRVLTELVEKAAATPAIAGLCGQLAARMAPKPASPLLAAGRHRPVSPPKSNHNSVDQRQVATPAPAMF